ncbi:hypothetical protein [Pseudoduganella flava]|uniref:Uncharacterized protein n=1 Tax=Pseudoduganella flava TaxID=871742 RepID=A0ABX6FMQ0_9BURK|nr:hypothetical protein [Pseudoduganella flava]QGZ37792.1 hypothetical protein GO485_01120 [Pseudoduganella flava]
MTAARGFFDQPLLRFRYSTGLRPASLTHLIGTPRLRSHFACQHGRSKPKSLFRKGFPVWQQPARTKPRVARNVGANLANDIHIDIEKREKIIGSVRVRSLILAPGTKVTVLPHPFYKNYN